MATETIDDANNIYEVNITLKVSLPGGRRRLKIPFTRMLTLNELCQQVATNAAQLSEEQRYCLAEKLAHAAYPSYKFADHGRLFLDDRKFIEKYKETMDFGNWHSLERKYLVNEMLKSVAHLKGDYVECGVWKGATAYWMCLAAERVGCKVHLFDSWEGLPDPSNKDGDYWKRGQFAVEQSKALEVLDGFQCCSFYRGWIPERFHEIKDTDVAFIHIDVDLYEPTLASLAVFYDRLLPGGIIICDDYGFRSCPGVKRAFDEFFSTKSESVAALPTGQALVIKL